MYHHVDATCHRKEEEGSFMTGREHMPATTREVGMLLRHERSQVLRLFTMVVALVAGIAIALGAVLSAAQAAPLGGLKQFRIPTADSQPRHITLGSDGNLWFTEGNEFFTPDPDPEMGGTFHNQIGRITPTGAITEFRVENCQCFLNDIVQGPNDILYFTTNNPALGRMTTSGQVLDNVAMPNSNAIPNSIAAHGDDIWFTDFNNNSLWRYNVSTNTFTQFPVPTPNANPYDVAVASDGTVWFTEFHANQIGRLDPATGTITETAVSGGPRHIAIATDGSVWATERFQPSATEPSVVWRLDPNTNQVAEFPLSLGAGPEDIAAAPNGAMWFTQFGAGNIARITSDGTISEGRRVRDSGPLGITVASNGDPWYVMFRANKVATLQLR
jgi:virginiamycin B lyase